MDLFDTLNEKKRPLSIRMRPKTLDRFVGQKHILDEKCLLVKAIKCNCVGNSIFYGPPGTGKTTLANIIANVCNGNFVKLNAIYSGVADAKKVIDEAKNNFKMYGKRTFLLLDECHRWSKAQSDCVLEAMEDGSIVFIGATTENPYFSMTRAIVSRCTVYEFKSLTDDDVLQVLNNALADSVDGLGEYNVKIDDNAIRFIAHASCGDVRSALNALELAVLSTNRSADGSIHIDLNIAENSIQKKALSVDDSMFYDILSAFCKSLRGSDAEAALYYANRLILAGCDPLIIARRLIAHASEDVGMADSMALVIANAALQTIKEIGFPEANIPLSHAIIYVCEAPKSNSVVVAMDSAIDDAKNHKDDNIPSYLKNNNNLENEHPENYKYPHNFGGYIYQQYMPDSLKDRVYYKPSNNGYEKDLVRKKKKRD